jgi:hypothetical protein
MNDKKIQSLQQELYVTLQKAGVNHKRIQLFRFLCYGGATLYFLALMATQAAVFSGGDMSFFYTTNPDPTFMERYKLLIYIAPLFALILIGSYGLSYFLQKYAQDERTAIRRIINELFPEADSNFEESELSVSHIIQSNFFGNVERRKASGYAYGSITFNENDRKITFRDALIHTGKGGNPLSETTLGGMWTIAKTLYRGLFAKRLENIADDGFRGLFADAQLEKKINGAVIVLPDRLERHLDYLAKNIQALKNINGCRLVSLEDVEFERFFAVYAGDEITARYVLTPAMMQRMTALRQKYNREVMLSFNYNRFYFAVAMPEGFLTFGNAPIASDHAFGDLYESIATARNILKDLKIK